MFDGRQARRQIVDLERQVAELQRREAELVAKVQQLSPDAASEPPTEPKPYVGLRSLLGGAGKESVPASESSTSDTPR